VVLGVPPPVDGDRCDGAVAPAGLVRGRQFGSVVVGHISSFVTSRSSHGRRVLGMTRLKVAVALGDTTGVSHYRLKWPAQAVAEETGWDVRTYRHDQIAVAETPGRYLVKGLDLEGLDLFVMSRPPALKHVRMLSHLQRLGVGV